MFDDVFGLVDSMMNVDNSETLDHLSGADLYLDHPHEETFAFLDSTPQDLPTWETQMSTPPLDTDVIQQADSPIPEEIHDLSQVTVDLELDETIESPTTIESATFQFEARDIDHDPGGPPDGMVGIEDSMAVSAAASPYSASQPLVAGDWAGDASTWHLQEDLNSCAIACQTDVLHSFGIEVEESQIAGLAQERGWYDPRVGTDPGALGEVLEEFGIPVTKSYDTSLVDIKDALDEGRKVLVGLDANEIWYPQRDELGNPLELPDGGHAVWVTGIAENPSGDLEVILNDTGHEAGRGSRVAIDDFLNAWNDFGRNAAITDVSPGGTYVS